MLFVWIALWLVAVSLFAADPKSALNRRLSLLSVSGGAGALAAVLANDYLPYVREFHPNVKLENALYHVQAASSLFSYYGVPYFFILFALAYRPLLSKSRVGERALPPALLLPIVLCLLLTPGYNENTPVSHDIVVWWAVPYFLAGAALILLKRPRHSSLSPSHWIICFAVLPPALFCMLMSYVLPSLGMLRMWRYNTWFVVVGVVAFLVGIFTYGFLGTRVLIERRRLDSTLRAVTSGTAILNHAIKNDVGKMRLFGEKTKAYAIATNQPELLADIETMLRASGHIQEMISRVQRKTEDLAVRPEKTDIGKLIRNALKPFEPMLGETELRLDADTERVLAIDPAQVSEAIGNLVANALEAMNGKGRLSVVWREGKREYTLEIRDDGPGMDKLETIRALEPFFTTKGGKEGNFGLGLPYAYYVMRKHGGSLQLKSKPGEGTSVFLVFPVRAAANIAEGSEAIG